MLSEVAHRHEGQKSIQLVPLHDSGEFTDGNTVERCRPAGRVFELEDARTQAGLISFQANVVLRGGDLVDRLDT